MLILLSMCVKCVVDLFWKLATQVAHALRFEHNALLHWVCGQQKDSETHIAQHIPLSAFHRMRLETPLA
jgi:hypothetical protein